MFTTLISVEQLQKLQKESSQHWMIFDCTFDLTKPEIGLEQFKQAHIANALYVDLNSDLSCKNPEKAISGGRHPLPAREDWAIWLRQIGFRNDTQAIVYDRNAMNYCGRLWWMLKWAGHESVAVLDGGFDAWKNAGGAIESGEKKAFVKSNQATNQTHSFELRKPLCELISVAQVEQNLNQAKQTLIDARGAARYRGETEPFDPVAGHIPGALNRPFASNLKADGFFKSPNELRAEFAQLLENNHPQSAVHYCGSGVSATLNVLASEIAGLGIPALYSGSWSDWCSDSKRAVAKG